MSAYKPIHFPATREGALGAAKAFAPHMGSLYGSERNRVVPGHPFVSCLAPAIRIRLILEREVVQTALDELGSLQRCEKFAQEVNWRNYWRSWLELHPEVWTSYIQTRDEERGNLSSYQRRRIEQIEAGASNCEPMDNFARELVETGFLHNHARMWFAAYWIHTERLPWQLGSDFFERHLICACNASNTLSWRWVAGLQTSGKTYLARRSNLEKYCDPAYLGEEIGMERLEHASSVNVPEDPPFPTVRPQFDLKLGKAQGAVGLWISEDDLSPEIHEELSQTHFAAICTSVVAAPHKSDQSNGLRRDYRLQGASDAAKRAQHHWSVEPRGIEADGEAELVEQLVDWAKSAGIQTVVALKPFVGPAHSALEALRARLQKEGIGLQLLRRPEDAEMLQYATAGFFKFWQGAKKSLPQSAD